MPTSWISVTDGPKITVSAIVKNPTAIPRRVLDMAKNLFIADKVLRPGPPVPSGLAQHWESTPQFADDNVAIIEEFGEIPVLGGSLGNPTFVRTTKRGGAVVISYEMESRNDMDALNTRITQVVNTQTKTWDTAFITALTGNASLPTPVAATAVWSSSSSKIRHDIAQAMKAITEATDANGDYLGYVPDTLLIGTSTQADFIASDDVSKVFIGNVANQNPQLAGSLPNEFFGLTPMVTRSLPTGDAMVLQSGVVGYISDERSLSASPTKDHPDREFYRSNVVRQSLIGIDNPKAACLITGV